MVRDVSGGTVMRLVLASLAGLSAAALTGCADPYYAEAPAPPGYAVPAAAVVPAAMPGGCFRSHDIRNHSIAPDGHTLYIDVGGKGVYRITTNGACLAGAISSDPLVMEHPPGAQYVCKPIDLDISVAKGGGVATPCIIDTITPMTPAEVAALPPRLRP
jgi:hypothetical protein